MPQIQSPNDAALDTLSAELSELSAAAGDQDWPARQLQRCADYGVFRWFVPAAWGGLDWSTESITAGYLKLAAACLTTTFVITQRTGACRRIAAGNNRSLQDRLLPGLADGTLFATVGISHLTTSGQHLGKPMLAATACDEGYLLHGFSPWVTGAAHADHVVIGATDPGGQQLLFALPTDLDGVHIPEPPEYVGLSGSKTGKVICEQVRVPPSLVIAGPDPNVMSSGAGANTGGHQTSTLAIGLAAAAIEFLKQQSQMRQNLAQIAGEMDSQWQAVHRLLLEVAAGRETCSNDRLRTEANSLVLRSTQAALSAAKGTGYLATHPVGRWCREALFFLVWSCPQGVVDANLCELAGIHST